jgi:hypothetical protein
MSASPEPRPAQAGDTTIARVFGRLAALRRLAYLEETIAELEALGLTGALGPHVRERERLARELGLAADLLQ